MVDKSIIGEEPQKSPFTDAVKNEQRLTKKEKVREPKGSRSRLAPAPATSKDQSKHKPKKLTRGSVVYLSHLPQGCEEKSIRHYLEQFGKVLGVRLVRSKKTGRSRGFAFAEFAERDAAAVVVSTLNDFMMFKHVVKAELIKPSKDGKNAFRVFNSAPIKPENTSVARNRRAYLKKRDKVLDEKSELRVEAHTRRNLRRLQKKLEAKGITYQFKAGKDKSTTGNSAKGEDANSTLVQGENVTE